MKLLLSTMLVFALNTSFAESIEGLKVELNFDKNYDSTQVDSQYLKFVPENYRFPSSTSLGRKQKAKFELALEIMEEVVNSEEFKQKVLSYEKTQGVRAYEKNYLWKNVNDRLTNEDVYKLIMEGDEKSRSNTIGEMNFNSWVKVCRWYQRPLTWCRKVIGSTDPHNSKWIKLNWNFYKRIDTPKMINNMLHEWLHLLGFLHGPKATMRKEVPYIVGGIAEEVARGILERRQK